MTYVGFVLAILAAVLLSPALSFWLSRALRPVLAWLRPVEGTLAADSLIQAPRRTSGTDRGADAVAGAGDFAGRPGAVSYNSLADWMRIALNPDFFVTTAETLSSRSFVFPGVAGRRPARDRGRGRSAAGAQRARDGEERADHADRGRRGRGREARASASGGGELGGNVPAGGRGERRGGLGEFRAAARRAHGRGAGDSRAGRDPALADRGHRGRFFRSAGNACCSTAISSSATGTTIR